jgi:outer membrane protein OmpA-like peptidoglycan-associated protein
MKHAGIFVLFAIGAAALLLCAPQTQAQSVGYYEAMGYVGAQCAKDIEKSCKGVPLGGGRMQQCLESKQAAVSAQCKSSFAQVIALTNRRAHARATIRSICANDIKRLCAGIQEGDGNMVDCFFKVQKNVSPACRKAVDDAGYNVKLSAGGNTNEIQLGSGDILDSLSGVEAASPTLNARSLRQLAAQAVKDPSRANRTNRPPLSQELASHAQINIAIQFDFDKATIRPDSFAAVGLMADALYHPYLQGYCFLVIGHTDAKGSREYNLKLSQDRADAIRNALIKPFGIAPGRIEAVGLGEEQLLDAANPESAKNRRVQLVNIGKLDGNANCLNR